MIVTIGTADVKLNKTDKNYKRYLVIHSNGSYKLVDKDLFSLDTDNLFTQFDVKNYTNLQQVEV